MLVPVKFFKSIEWIYSMVYGFMASSTDGALKNKSYVLTYRVYRRIASSVFIIGLYFLFIASFALSYYYYSEDII